MGADESALDAIDPRQLLEVVRRYWLVIVGSVLLSTAAGWYLAAHEKPVYRTSAVIRLEDTRREMAGGLAEGAAAGTIGRSVDPLLSQIQVLTSHAVAAEVVDSMPLLRLRVEGFPLAALDSVAVAPGVERDSLRLTFAPTVVSIEHGAERADARYGAPLALAGIGFRIARPPAGGRVGVLRVRTREAAIGALRAGLKVEPRENTDVVDVTYVDDDPVRAQLVLNRLVEILGDASARSARQESRRRREFLQRQLARNDSLALEARRALSAFRSHEQAYSARDKFSAEQAGLSGLDVRREELGAERRIYQRLVDQLRAADTSRQGDGLRALVAGQEVTTNPVIAGLYEQLVHYETVYDSLTTGTYGRSTASPDVQRVRTLIASTQAKLVRAIGSVITALDTRIGALDELRNQNVAAFRSLSAAEEQEAVLVERVESARKLGDQLREEYHKAQLAEAVEAGQVEVVDLATGPGTPVDLGASRKIVFGLLVGLLLGGAAAFLLDRLNTSIRRQQEAETVLGLPGVMVIPRAEHRSLLADPRHRRRHPAAARRVRTGPPVHASLFTLAAPNSITAEAFRGLRTKLVFREPLGSLRALAVTSPEPRDGKTTVASNLAVTFAQLGQRVLLVDCDLRRPTLHQIIGAPQAPGLSNVLTRECPVEAAIQPTTVENLWLLPAGRIPPNPAELLGLAAMRELIALLRDSYDVVILDTPPLLACADAVVIGALVDGTLLVVRAGQTTRECAQVALQQFTDIGLPVIGAVLNDPDAKVSAYGGGYYYRYSYGYNTAH